MKKFKLFMDIEKEEKWLNDMAQTGYELTGKFLFYQFIQTKPNNATIKMDFRMFKKKADFEDYKALFEDSGWKHIAGTKSSGVQYFKKDTVDAENDIFSDTDSKAGRYKRISELYILLSVIYFPFFMIYNKPGSNSAILNPKELYYTPGLWEMTGARFWGAFLFETPFALMRGSSLGFLVIMFALFLIYSIKAERQYRKIKNSKIM